MKVYVVDYGSCPSDIGVDGVFSSEELAKAYCDAQNARRVHKWDTSWGYHEYELDELGKGVTE